MMRAAVMALAVIATIAAWPQAPSLPPVDHSQHPLVEIPEGQPGPALRIRLSADTMDGFNVFLETQNFRFTPENVDTAPVANEGHAHLYVNGEKVARMYSPWHHLPGKLLREGINRLEVEFSTNDHAVWGAAGDPIGADVLIDTRVTDGDPIIREDVRYTLDWDWGAAMRHRDGGWVVRTDLGYRVHVTAGQVVTRNLELVPCHAMPPAPQASLMRWLGPVQVAAGHSSLIPNESKISDSYAEDLAAPNAMFLESRLVTDPEYCKAHYLIARGRGSAPDAPALTLSGTWARSAHGRATPFQMQSAGAYGEFKELRTASGDLPRRMIVGGL